MKTVGKRRPGKGLEWANRFLHLVNDLTAQKPFIPKGVFKFKTFEDAQKFSLACLTRKSKKS